MHNNEFKINWLINMLKTLTCFNNGKLTNVGIIQMYINEVKINRLTIYIYIYSYVHKIITHKYNKILLPS